MGHWQELRDLRNSILIGQYAANRATANQNVVYISSSLRFVFASVWFGAGLEIGRSMSRGRWLESDLDELSLCNLQLALNFMHFVCFYFCFRCLLHDCCIRNGIFFCMIMCDWITSVDCWVFWFYILFKIDFYHYTVSFLGAFRNHCLLLISIF